MPILVMIPVVLWVMFLFLYLDAKKSNKKKKKLLAETDKRANEVTLEWDRAVSTNTDLKRELLDVRKELSEALDQVEGWKVTANSINMDLFQKKQELSTLHSEYEQAINKYDEIYKEYQKIRPAKQSSLSDRLSQLLEQSDFHIDNITNQD